MVKPEWKIERVFLRNRVGIVIFKVDEKNLFFLRDFE
jgi:hypothetical protein